MKIKNDGNVFVQNSVISNKSLKLYTHTHTHTHTHTQLVSAEPIFRPVDLFIPWVVLPKVFLYKRKNENGTLK